MHVIYLSISRMSCMLFRARGRAGSRVRIVRIAARCPRAKSRVFVRRRILFARSRRASGLRVTCISRVDYVCRAASARDNK